MISMNKSNKTDKSRYLKYINTKNSDCNVSKASNELMLNRISGGKEIEFPFIKQ